MLSETADFIVTYVGGIFLHQSKSVGKKRLGAYFAVKLFGLGFFFALSHNGFGFDLCPGLRSNTVGRNIFDTGIRCGCGCVVEVLCLGRLGLKGGFLHVHNCL